MLRTRIDMVKDFRILIPLLRVNGVGPLVIAERCHGWGWFYGITAELSDVTPICLLKAFVASINFIIYQRRSLFPPL